MGVRRKYFHEKARTGEPIGVSISILKGGGRGQNSALRRLSSLRNPTPIGGKFLLLFKALNKALATEELGVPLNLMGSDGEGKRLQMAHWLSPMEATAKPDNPIWRKKKGLNSCNDDEGFFLNGSESGLKGSDKRSEAPPLRENFIPVYYFF
jgi:hypothetical protein